ncbi:MAG: sigma-54-dependent Fis family transcriptional regulator, partial [Spirochaetaceae bacterium]|nr:sigma-54-dependent Fis family transcriptional regulator [Spirochaetaceae bacterium]
FYRLNVISCNLPPLHQRIDDIPLLTEHFIRHYSERYNKAISGIRPELQEQLTQHLWPGNIRELQNLINQAVLLCEGSEITSLRGWDRFDGDSESPKEHDPGDEVHSGKLKDATEWIVSRFEKKFINEALLRNRGNRTRTAEELDVTRKTHGRKIEKYGL